MFVLVSGRFCFLRIGRGRFHPDAKQLDLRKVTRSWQSRLKLVVGRWLNCRKMVPVVPWRLGNSSLFGYQNDFFDLRTLLS